MRKGRIDRLLVYKLLKQVPKGKVTTYGSLAKASGHPRAARAIGALMRCNPYAPYVPCHRVVGSDGSLIGFGGSRDTKEKARMLRSEGVPIRGSKVIDLKKYFYHDYSIARAKMETLP